MDNQQIKTLKQIKDSIPKVICDRKEFYEVSNEFIGGEPTKLTREEWLEAHLQYVMDSIEVMFYEELEQFSSKEKEQRSIEGGKD